MKRKNLIILASIISFAGLTFAISSFSSYEKRSTFDIKSGGYRENNPVEDIYKELTEKSEKLQNLEENLNNLYSKESELNSEWNKFNQYNESYYKSAETMNNLISDSTLKNKIQNMLRNSISSYHSKSKEWKDLQTIIANKNQSIDDQYSALKILLTLQEIQKYQQKNTPDKQLLRSHITQQDAVLKEIISNE